MESICICTFNTSFVCQFSLPKIEIVGHGLWQKYHGLIHVGYLSGMLQAPHNANFNGYHGL